MSANDERAQLQRARELIMQQRFSEARMILRSLQDHPTAQQWLAKLDAIAPPEPESPVAPAPDVPSDASAASTTTPPVGGVPGTAVPPAVRGESQQVNLAFNLDVQLVRYILAGVIGVMGVLMIAAFFVAPWMDMGNINFMGFSADMFGGEVDRGPLEITASEIWFGRNGDENFTLDLAVEDGGSGFADVRLVDRFLIVVPVLGLVLAWLAWVYAFPGDLRNARLSIAGMIAIVAFILLVFPFAWEELSTNAMEDDLESMMQMEGDTDLDDFGFFFDMGMFTGIYTDAYSTGEQQMFGILAMVAALLTLGLEFMAGGSRKPVPPPAAH